MSERERPLIYIKRFYTEYPVRDGKTVEEDWVEYSPIGGAQYLSVPQRIKDLQPVADTGGKASQNPAVQMARARWEFIGPRYEAWKKGQTAPVNGTPLAAWPGVSPSQAEVLRLAGVYSVEDVAALTDAHKGRIQLPGMAALVDHAKRFLASVDKTAVSKALEEKDQEIADLKAQMEELANMVRSQAAAEPRRGPGRPPKQPAETPAA